MKLTYWINKRLFRPEVVKVSGKWMIHFSVCGERCSLPYRYLSHSNAEADMRRYFSEKIYTAQDFR